MKRYISDLITKEEIEQWKPQETVIISAGTGKGKSHFILNTLNDFAKNRNKKILLLVPRSAIQSQFNESVELLDTTVTVQTYQWLEQEILSDYYFDLSFDYIVADESHYFLSDSNFNTKTSESFEFLMRSKAITIFMSATGKAVQALIEGYSNKKISVYTLPNDYSNINHVYFYKSTKSNPYAYVSAKLFELQENTDDKALVFINNIHYAQLIAQRFSKSAILLHKGNAKKVKLQNVIKNEKFDKQFLITTSFLDTGVTLKDLKLKHIFIDHSDINSVIQMIGRKRFIDKSDTVTLHIRDFTNQSIGGMLTSIKRKLVPLDYCIEHGFTEFLKRYQLGEINNKQIQGIGYTLTEDGHTNRVHPMIYLNFKLLQNYYSAILQHKNGYRGVVNNMLNTENKHTVVEEMNKREVIIDYLREINDTRLYDKEEKDELVKVINAQVNRRLISTPKGLTGYLSEIDIPCKIESIRDNRRTIKDHNGNKIPNPNHNKTFWRAIFEEENLSDY